MNIFSVSEKRTIKALISSTGEHFKSIPNSLNPNLSTVCLAWINVKPDIPVEIFTDKFKHVLSAKQCFSGFGVARYQNYQNIWQHP